MNRIIVVTGANNGIGLALTQSLVEMGDRVAAAGFHFWTDVIFRVMWGLF